MGSETVRYAFQVRNIAHHHYGPGVEFTGREAAIQQAENTARDSPNVAVRVVEVRRKVIWGPEIPEEPTRE